MGNIVLLDDLTINKIAAGEVIENPAAAIKEMVENSIDAGATSVTVEVKNGGKSLIKITDNGKGIAKEDLPLSIERHATSKLKQIEDLEKIDSFGFRGEALASIASISKMTIISKMADDLTSTKMVVEAGDILEISEDTGKTGTTIIIESLFFNVPVRYKFLKNDATEFRYIKSMLEKIAISNPGVAIKLINNGKEVFKISGNGKLEDVIYVLFGKRISQNLVKVNYEENGIEISGFIGNTTIAVDSRKDELFFLNKRYIQNKTLYSSADEAFKGDAGIGKFSFAIINLKMPPFYYDVNIHPTKKEVKFKDEGLVYRALYTAIKNAVLSKEFLGNKAIEENKEYVNSEFKYVTNHFINPENIKTDIQKINNISESEDANELIKRENARKIEYKFIGISFKTYIMIEINNEMYLIDQHAAHERIMYEQIKNNYKNKINTNTQMMLIPELIELPNKEIEFIKENIDLIQNTGFDIELFGDKTIKINGVPDLEYKSKLSNRRLFLDILDEMTAKQNGNFKSVEERFIATVACKAAVKAGMSLTEKEVDYLIQNLLTLKNPYTCPHGRPTTVKFSKKDFI